MMARGVTRAQAMVRPEGLGRCGGPLDDDGREVIGVRRLLEWAFAREAASLDFDEVAPVQAGYDSTRAICEAMALSTGDPGTCLRVDTSPGRGLPHHDAEVVVSVLRRSVPWSTAVQVAELARTCRAPAWDLGPQRIVPVAWRGANQHGQAAATQQIGEVRYKTRRGMVRKAIFECPVRIEPSASQIAAARRAYLDWCGALLAVLGGLRGVDLELFRVSDALPPIEPWKKRG